MTDALTPREAELAAMSGVQRRIRARYEGRRDRWGRGEPGRNDPAGWSSDIQGTIGEWLIAKARGVYWPGADRDHMYDGDLCDGTEVRSRTEDWRDLLLHPDDDDDRAFVLVLGVWPRLRIGGWITGGEGKRPEYWNETLPVPAYTVPQTILRPLDEL